MDKIITTFLEDEIKKHSNVAINFIKYGSETDHMRELLKDSLKERSKYKRSLRGYKRLFN